MHYTKLQYAQALYALTDNVSADEAQKYTEQFIRHIKTSGQGHLLKGILTAYKEILTKKNELPEVIVRSASQLSEAQITEVLTSLEIDTGRPVKNVIDKEMIGGFFVKDNNRAFDLSLKRRLMRLGQKLEDGH